jgi:hypothetical protein
MFAAVLTCMFGAVFMPVLATVFMPVLATVLMTVFARTRLCVGLPPLEGLPLSQEFDVSFRVGFEVVARGRSQFHTIGEVHFDPHSGYGPVTDVLNGSSKCP